MPEFEAGIFTAGTLVGIFLGAFLGHALAVRRGKFQVKHNAAIEFRKVLMPAVLDIDTGKDSIEIITASFPTHFEAARRYTVYLSARNLRKFTETLSEYKNWHETVCNRAIEDRMYGNKEPNYLEMKKTNPLKYLHGLLEYAST